jgi:integrase/recombinase XerD
MLTLWRRHKETCPHATDRYFRKCKCAMWCEGTVEGKYLRKSLKTRSWERADELKRDIEDGKADKKQITIEDALKAFIADCSARNLNPSTLRKYNLLRSKLSAFAENRGIVLLAGLEVDQVRAFRELRTLAPRTAGKELERLRAFFNFCVENGWLAKNPAKGVKAPITYQKQVEPFSRDEQAKILQTAYRLAMTQEAPEKGGLPVHPKTGTFAKLLLHSGLRITDAAMLTKERLQDDRLFLYAQKNKRPVTVPLPPDLVAELKAISEPDLFRSPEASTRPETVSDYWRDQLIKVFTAAEIKAHPHRFRHSLAVNMLSSGSSVEDVAAVLGNSPAIVAKHYSAWVQARQERIDTQIQKAWMTPKLVRVK